MPNLRKEIIKMGFFDFLFAGKKWKKSKWLW